MSFLLAQGLPLPCPISEGVNGEGSKSPLHFQINLRATCKVDSVESGVEARWCDVSGDGDAMMGSSQRKYVGKINRTPMDVGRK